MRSKCMRYSSSSASRSPCWARSTRRRTFTSAGRLIRLCFPAPPTGLTPGSGGGEADPARAVEAPEVRDLGNHHMVRAFVGVEDDDPGPVLVQRPLQLVSRLQGHERPDHLSALEPDLDSNPLAASHPTPPP